MNSAFLKNYKAFIIAAVLIIGLSILLIEIGFIIFINEPIYILSNTLAIITSWLVLSFLIHKFYVYKTLVGLGLLVAATVADYYLKAVNPISITVLLLFWLGVVYLISPEFFKKYQVAILSIYGAILSYFFVFRMMPDYMENHHQTFLNFTVIPIPVFAALWGYEQWRWLKTLQDDKGKAELALLKSQINPHFFFNTLNNLYGLVVEKSDQAPDVVLKLSDMMRYTIYEGKEDLVYLTNEIKYLETYIELHKIRFQKKVDIQFTHEVKKEIQVAPLLFIILLENAFKHGVERLTENAYIHLDFKMRGNQIFFTIENNYEPNASIQKAGIGLGNLKKRLSHLYPNRHELVIEKTDSTYTAHLNLLLNLDVKA